MEIEATKDAGGYSIAAAEVPTDVPRKTMFEAQVDAKRDKWPPDVQEIMKDFGTTDPKVVWAISNAAKRWREIAENQEKIRHKWEIDYDASMQPKLKELAGANIELNAYISQLEDAVKRHSENAMFDEETVELIKAHVRHPGAIEAAVLKERIRCALACLTDSAHADVVRLVLSGEAP